MASGHPNTEKSMPRRASFFDAMSGVKKLTGFIPAITCATLANETSYDLSMWIVKRKP